MHTPIWPGVELRHLIALQAVAEEASFNGAAKRLGYTQSAISQQIAGLERAVGQKLVERRSGAPQPVQLTESGEILLRHAHAIQERVASAQSDLEALAAGTSGTLRIGTFQSIGALLLPAFIRRFRASFPEIEIGLKESHLDVEFIRGLRRGELDLAFLHLPLPPGPFASRLIFEDEYVLLVPAGSALARRKCPPTCEELVRLPLVGFANCRGHEQVVAYFRSRLLEPSFVLRSDDSHTIQAFVANGFGVALVPKLVAEAAMSELEVIALTDGPPPRRLAVAWSTERAFTPAMEAFVGIAESAVTARRRTSASLAARGG